MEQMCAYGIGRQKYLHNVPIVRYRSSNYKVHYDVTTSSAGFCLEAISCGSWSTLTSQAVPSSLTQHFRGSPKHSPPPPHAITTLLHTTPLHSLTTTQSVRLVGVG